MDLSLGTSFRAATRSFTAHCCGGTKRAGSPVTTPTLVITGSRARLRYVSATPSDGQRWCGNNRAVATSAPVWQRQCGQRRTGRRDCRTGSCAPRLHAAADEKGGEPGAIFAIIAGAPACAAVRRAAVAPLPLPAVANCWRIQTRVTCACGTSGPVRTSPNQGSSAHVGITWF